jgi:hypothetical protein
MGKSWIIVRFTLVLTISSLVLIIGYQSMNNTQQSMADSWMFKGAYATYEGKIDAPSIPINLDETIQVTELNTIHVQILTIAQK